MVIYNSLTRYYTFGSIFNLRLIFFFTHVKLQDEYHDWYSKVIQKILQVNTLFTCKCLGK